MRLIFSRKGFDSQYGRIPSPIFPDGSLCSLPIPSAAGRPLSDCRGTVGWLTDVVRDLSSGKLSGSTSVHLDPDLAFQAVPRSPGWRPSFGQIGAAQSHLAKQDVGAGDVFLFYGWFRPAEHCQGRWRYVPKSDSFHSLFGWLQVSDVIDVGSSRTTLLSSHPWLEDHPHVRHASRFTSNNNTLYLSAPGLKLGAHETTMPGGGIFRAWSDRLRLSAPGSGRSIWRLPSWIEPQGRPALTYHADSARWSRHQEGVHLQTVAKGQEFVLDACHYPEAETWLRELIEAHA